MFDIHRLTLTTRQLWALTILLGVFMFINTRQIVPNDFWWHMASGREILRIGQIPIIDVYSYTMTGAPYLSYQMFWLMDIGLYGLYSLGGPELVLFVHSLIITGTYFLVLLLCWQTSRKWGVVTVCLIFAITLGIYTWNVRPQAISFLFGMIFLYAIYAYRLRPNLAWLILFPVVMLVWVNSHGTFVIGIVLIGIWLLDEFWKILTTQRTRIFESLKPLLAPGTALLLTIGAGLLHQLRLGIFTYLWTMLGNPVNQKYITEWAPASIDSPIGLIFILGIFFSAVVFAISPRRPTFFEMTFFLTFALLGFATTRGIIWYGLFIAPILASHLSEITSIFSHKGEKAGIRSESKLLNLSFLGLLVLLSIAILPWFRSVLPINTDRRNLFTQDTPIEAVRYLMQEKPPGYLFNDSVFGSYIIWAAYPEYKVFVDPRVELYNPEIWMDYLWITNALPGWDNKLEEYKVHTLLLDPRNQESLIRAVEESSHWRLAYQDKAALIFVHNH